MVSSRIFLANHRSPLTPSPRHRWQLADQQPPPSPAKRPAQAHAWQNLARSEAMELLSLRTAGNSVDWEPLGPVDVWKSGVYCLRFQFHIQEEHAFLAKIYRDTQSKTEW